MAWPEGAEYCTQDTDGELGWSISKPNFSHGFWSADAAKDWVEVMTITDIADDLKTAIITREQWEATQ